MIGRCRRGKSVIRLTEGKAESVRNVLLKVGADFPATLALATAAVASNA
jgi:hypothetical protein